MRCIKWIFTLLVVLVVAGLVTVYSGVIDVAATSPHAPLTRWLLATVMDNSVRYHAREIVAPPLDDPELVMAGYRHYREMCVECHLAPGVTSSEMREGLLPEPPELQEAVDEWSPAELFWVIRNGVKMTGMPAWGLSHSDDEMWAIVAFLERLPRMTAAEYEAMGGPAGAAESVEGGHHHHEGP
jgi:mono/diheme cytochrome c family protein